MATKTITITVDAYNRLKYLKKDEKESFSDIIIKLFPERRKLSDVLTDYGPNIDLAKSIQKASDEMRLSKMHAG